MNLKEEKYSRYAIIGEMLESVEIIRSFDPAVSGKFVGPIRAKAGLFLTGEGSSRLFPAKRAIYAHMKKKFSFPLLTEGCTQAREYDLNDFAVFAASNSGQTKEVIRLVNWLKEKKHDSVFGLTANRDSWLEQTAHDSYILSCGKEAAVAATKSVIEQGLFYDCLLRNLRGEKMEGLAGAADQCLQVLSAKVDETVISMICNAGTIYYAGRDNGVAAELALKTMEIIRKKAIFLEGTIALHGIEEVMDKGDVLIWVDPFDVDHDKFMECLVRGAGVNVIAISVKPTDFPSFIIPDGGEYAEYVHIAAGWNLLVEAGLSLGIDIDHPKRARKVGNEYNPGS